MIVRKVFTDPSKYTIDYYRLIKGEIPLTSDEQKRWDQICGQLEKDFDADFDHIEDCLRFLKKDRNYDIHEKYQPSNANIPDLKGYIERYCDQFSQGQDDLKYISDKLVNYIKNEFGDYPFDHYNTIRQSERPKRRKKRV